MICLSFVDTWYRLSNDFNHTRTRRWTRIQEWPNVGAALAYRPSDVGGIPNLLDKFARENSFDLSPLQLF
ncbi:hypothetical protein VTN00DRAFT_5437 [Thermoascus crustaceus]|uniref:uncharacterized protein n=1 Tax=Thermoascus crustaceus TaxID=5088 RepID=UPI003742ED93